LGNPERTTDYQVMSATPAVPQPLRILHLEDSPLDAELVLERLIDAGLSIQLDWAANERDFTSFLSRGGYDLILADFRLPCFDAPAALLLAKSFCPDIPFIAVTGAVGEEEAVAFLKQGATDYVLKGQLSKLPGTIERALDEYRERRARQQAEEMLRRLNRELQAISHCNQVLVRADSEKSLLDAICRIVCDDAGYCMAWVGYAENDEAKTIRIAASADVEPSYLEAAGVTWADTERGRGAAGTAIRSGKSAFIADFATDPRAAPWRSAALQRGYRSCLCLPLKDDDAHTFGVLVIYSLQTNAFCPEEIRMLEELSGDLAFGIGALRTRAERAKAERRIEHLAFYDPLTELPNRRLLMDRLRQAMSGNVRSLQTGALLFIDLDNFKMLNDTCGHDVGDRLLIEVARRLATCIREGDTISRLGGDEFVIMLVGLSEHAPEAAAQAKAVGEKVLSTLNQPYAVGGQAHHSTASMGATLFMGNEGSLDDPLKQADIAMYQAKAAGRNALRFFDPAMQAALAARTDLEAALRQGIDQQQFALYYQAQVHGRSNIIGAEALIRWHHPTRGLVYPAEFIPLAEETCLILPIGQWVLEEACTQLARWSHDPRCRDLHLAVNVSARQFRQVDFVERVRIALERSGAPAANLKLELTESLVLDNITDSIDKMHVLKKLGVNFSMDDFGTGYSSLSYLTRLPLHQLKIDKSFVHNLPDNQNDAVVAQTIITMAKSLGLNVIAEGVETEAQQQFLAEHGCPIYQGYLFSEPVPLDEFLSLLHDQTPPPADEFPEVKAENQSNLAPALDKSTPEATF
jgi:diguanylate cyclase (GGDEF)-like protein